MQKKKTTSKKHCNRNSSLLLFLFIPVFITAAFLTTQAQAENIKTPAVYKYYTSIRVENGDTLWEIAKQYRTEEYSDISSYIEEVKSINHLSTSRITDGMYLCIPYYTTEYKE